MTSPPLNHRTWLPKTGLLISLLAIIGSYFVPADYPPFVGVAVITVGVYLALLITAVWWLFFSRFPWARRIVVLAAVIALRYALIREVDYSGDVVPRYIFRWEADRNALVEADRAKHEERGKEIRAEAGADDYPSYRNRNLDAAATGPELQTDWTKPPRLVWKQPVGGGYAAFAVAGDIAVTIEQRRDSEVVAAYDFSTGQELWTHSWKARQFDEMGGEGPMATPAIDQGRVYAMGGTGKFLCLDVKTGKPFWEKDLLLNNANLQWGMSASPLIYQNLVIVNPGEQKKKQLDRAIRAFDKITGDPVWSTGNSPAGYCSPMVVNLLGQETLVIFDGEEIAGYQPTDGKKLWQLPWGTNQGVNVAQPIPLGQDKLFLSSSYGKGCGLIQLKKEGEHFIASEVWHNFYLRCRFTSPLLIDQHIYGLDEGALVCLDPATGRRAWKGDRYGQGQLLRQGNLLLIQAENGDLALVEASPAAFKQVARFKALSGKKTWNCPALARGFAFVRNHHEMACYDLRK